MYVIGTENSTHDWSGHGLIGILGDLEPMSLNSGNNIRDGGTCWANQSGQREQHGVVEVPENAEEYHENDVCNEPRAIITLISV